MSSSSSPAGLPEARGWSQLLARLHGDPEQAAQEYDRLRRRLVRFFDWRGVTMPDDWADVVLDRLARKVEEAEVEDVLKFAYGIARLVALEAVRRPATTALDPLMAERLPAPEADVDDHPLQGCFDRCLATLPGEQRQVLLDYYVGERATKIANRRRLAASLGISENALRSRVQRQRDLLERCVRSCDAAGSPAA